MEFCCCRFVACGAPCFAGKVLEQCHSISGMGKHLCCSSQASFLVSTCALKSHVWDVIKIWWISVFSRFVLSCSHSTWVVLCRVQLPGPAVTQPEGVDVLTAVCDVLNPKSAAVQCSFKTQSSYLLFGIVVELKLRAMKGLPKFGMRA